MIGIADKTLICPILFVWICEVFVRREYFAVTKTVRNGFQLVSKIPGLGTVAKFCELVARDRRKAPKIGG